MSELRARLVLVKEAIADGAPDRAPLPAIAAPSAKTPEPTDADAPDDLRVRAHLESARARCKPGRGADADAIYCGKLIEIALQAELVTDRAQLVKVAAAVAVTAPRGTTAAQLERVLLGCARGFVGDLPAIAEQARVLARHGWANLPRGAKDGGLHEHENFAPERALVLMNARFSWIESQQAIAAFTGERLDRLEWRKVDGFRTTWNNRKVVVPSPDGANTEPLATWWLANADRRTHECVGLWPPPLRVPERALNLWSGFAVVPRRGDWSRMRAHIRDVIAAGDPAVDDYIIRWAAWTFQNPGSRAEAAIVMRGDEGTGKGTFGNALARIFGTHAVHVTRPDHFVGGRFNRHMAECVYFFADECYWAGDRSHEGTLKGLLTEPTVRVEPKGIDSYEVANLLHVLISSNNEWVVPAGVNARRFVVTNVSGARMGDHAYFKALATELDEGGLSAMLHDLLRLDLAGWHPRLVVDSEALREQKAHSLSPGAKWTLEILREAELPPCSLRMSRRASNWISSEDLLVHARETVPEDARSGRWSTARVSKALRAIGAVPHKEGGDRGWTMPQLQVGREAWCKSHYRCDWPDAAATWR